MHYGRWRRVWWHNPCSLRENSPGCSGDGAGKGRRNLQLRLWNLNICIGKVDAKCWLAEMTKVMTSLPLIIVFHCLFTFALVFASPWLAEIWQLNRRGATGELQVEFKIRRRSCKRMSVKRGFRVGTRTRVRVRVSVNPYPKTAFEKKNDPRAHV